MFGLMLASRLDAQPQHASKRQENRQRRQQGNFLMMASHNVLQLSGAARFSAGARNISHGSLAR